MSDKPNQAEDSDKQVEIWKIKRVCFFCWDLMWPGAAQLCMHSRMVDAVDQSIGGGQREWDVHDFIDHATKGSGKTTLMLNLLWSLLADCQDTLEKFCNGQHFCL